MGCKIAENEPLKKLRGDLGLPSACHSMRQKCVMGMSPRTGENVLASQGAIIGYCQALFASEGSADKHSEKLIHLLEKIKAPWSRSHELFWGYKPESQDVEGYVQNASRPLLGSGRVPILISNLEVSKDKTTIHEIIESENPAFEGETVLLRMILEENRESIDEAVSLVNKLAYASFKNNVMPRWWPLFQTSIEFDDLEYMKKQLNDYWSYINFAVNPFCLENLIDFCPEQVTVAQWVVSELEGINLNGEISSNKIPMFGIGGNWKYSLADYAKHLARLPEPPTNIVLGPSKPDWSDDYNLNRIEKYLDIMKPVLLSLWYDISDARKEDIWRLAS